MKIKAAVFEKVKQPFQIEQLDLESPQEGEVLIKMAAAGVCHSDWNLVLGATNYPTPVVPGHEGSGVVVECGPGVRDLKVGDHVALNWAPACGNCFYCLNGQPALCGTYVAANWAGTMLDGTTRLKRNGKPVYHFSNTACFADYTVVPQQCCVRLPEAVPFNVAALIGCAVTTGVGAAVHTAQVKPGSSVVVFGAGGVGLSIVMGALLCGAGKVIVVDANQVKKEISKLFGATEFIHTGEDVIEKIKELTDGRGADYAFEAVGIPAVQEQCLAAARPGGTIILAGLSAMGSSTNLPGAIITRQEKTIKGSYYGSANTTRDFPFFASLFTQGKLALDLLVSQTYPLEQINEAYARMLSGETARGVIVF